MRKSENAVYRNYMYVIKFLLDAETSTINAVVQASMKNKSYKATVSQNTFIS